MAGREPVRINLVEQDGWKKYDFASGKLDWTYDQAWEDFRHMSTSDLASHIEDLWTSSPGKGKRRPRRKLDSEELEYLADRVKDGDDTLEPVRRAIVDAANWMYEIAAIPDDGDVLDARDSALESIKEDPEINEAVWAPILMREVPQGPKEWAPKHGRLSESELVDQLLEYIRFDHDKGQWDRYFIFNMHLSPAVEKLHEKFPERDDQVDAEFRHLRDKFLSYFFKALEKTMADVDIYNRADWRPNWESMLSDGSVVSEAQEAIRNALAEMPEEADES